METNSSNVQDNDLEIVQNLINIVKLSLSNYLNTVISGDIVRRVYIKIRKVFTQPELYDIDCTYRIIVTGGYVISTGLNYELLEYFKLNENNLKSL